MKILLTTMFTVIFLGTILFSNTQFASAEVNINLISNPDFETIDSTINGPLGWSQDQWGDNTAKFSYEPPANNSDSGYSAKVVLSARKNGDAKWYFDPVPVEPNTDYIFSDYYKSNKQTSIVAMSMDESNNPTYFDIATTVPISNVWKNKSYTFRTPANAKTLTIFHLLKKNGWLQIDNVSLKPKTSTTPVSTNVPNNSVETISDSDPTLPDQWSHSVWGTNTPIFEYSNDGHTGNHGIKLTMTDYQSGDAKWQYTPQTLQNEKDYKFTAWYKTNTIPHVVAQYIKSDGSEEYFGLPNPEPTGEGWQQYGEVFRVPQDVKSVALLFYLSNNGWLITDDYSITPYTYEGFSSGMVTITFDDGFEKNVSNALPILDKYSFKTTYCYATKYLEDQPEQVSILNIISNKGHEACSHSANHDDLTLMTPTAINYELLHSKNYLEQMTSSTITTFTSPYGAYNSTVINDIQRYYLAHRTTNEGYNSKDSLDIYRLKVQNIQSNTTLAQFKEWVNKAKTDKTWLILVYHAISSDGTADQFDSKIEDFEAQMEWLSETGIAVEPMNKALQKVSQIK